MIEIEDLFGTRIQIEIIEFYKKEPGALAHVSELARELHYCHATIKKASDKLVKTGFLRQLRIGRTNVLMLNRSDDLYDKVFNFMDVIENKSTIRTFP